MQSNYTVQQKHDSVKINEKCSMLQITLLTSLIEKWNGVFLMVLELVPHDSIAKKRSSCLVLSESNQVPQDCNPGAYYQATTYI